MDAELIHGITLQSALDSALEHAAKDDAEAAGLAAVQYNIANAMHTCV